jgi:hypothetical protein
MEVYFPVSLMSAAEAGAEVLPVIGAPSFLQEMANNKIAASPVLIADFIEQMFCYIHFIEGAYKVMPG